MPTEITDLTLDILKKIQDEQAAHRRDTRAIQQSFVDLARVVQRLDARVANFETRISDLKADLETMFKMEIIGQSANLETRLEAIIDRKLS